MGLEQLFQLMDVARLNVLALAASPEASRIMTSAVITICLFVFFDRIVWPFCYKNILILDHNFHKKKPHPVRVWLHRSIFYAVAAIRAVARLLSDALI